MGCHNNGTRTQSELNNLICPAGREGPGPVACFGGEARPGPGSLMGSSAIIRPKMPQTKALCKQTQSVGSYIILALLCRSAVSTYKARAGRKFFPPSKRLAPNWNRRRRRRRRRRSVRFRHGDLGCRGQAGGRGGRRSVVHGDGVAAGGARDEDEGAGGGLVAPLPATYIHMFTGKGSRRGGGIPGHVSPSPRRAHKIWISGWRALE